MERIRRKLEACAKPFNLSLKLGARFALVAIDWAARFFCRLENGSVLLPKWEPLQHVFGASSICSATSRVDGYANLLSRVVKVGVCMNVFVSWQTEVVQIFELALQHVVQQHFAANLALDGCIDNKRDNVVCRQGFDFFRFRLLVVARDE